MHKQTDSSSSLNTTGIQIDVYSWRIYECRALLLPSFRHTHQLINKHSLIIFMQQSSECEKKI